MSRERINPPGVAKAPYFTRVITVTNPMKLVFVTGQTPQNEDGSCAARGDMRAQYLFVMEKLSLQLAVAGATWDDVTHRRAFVTDVPAYLKAIADPANPKFGGEQPCATMIGVNSLSNPDYLIEIDLIAAVTG